MMTCSVPSVNQAVGTTRGHLHTTPPVSGGDSSHINFVDGSFNIFFQIILTIRFTVHAGHNTLGKPAVRSSHACRKA